MYNQLSAQIVQDLVQSRWYLLGAVFGVVILCFLYILLLRWVVGPVVWTSIVGLIALMGFCKLLFLFKLYVFFDIKNTFNGVCRPNLRRRLQNFIQTGSYRHCDTRIVCITQMEVGLKQGKKKVYLLLY